MLKNILLSTLLCSFLGAQDFETFLKNAIQNSPYLKANQLGIAQANENANLTIRYKNPTLALEASNFSPDIGDSEAGYRVSLTQPIRLWGVSDAREDLATAQKSEAQSLVKLSRADFVRKLSLLYSKYKSTLSAESLAKEELFISRKITDITKARFENGTIAKVKYIQAKVDEKRVENFLNKMQVNTLSSYYRLIGFAGLTTEIELDNKHQFKLSEQGSTSNSAQLIYSKSKMKSALALAELHSNRVEWIDIYGEFESEPDQNIARVGVDIPLAIFNTKSQERTVAKLQAKKSELISENINTTLSMKLKELSRSIESLSGLQLSTSELYKSQKELLLMYEDAYKIASIDLIELQVIKNQMIRTKEDAIEIELSKEQNIIQHNFLTGEYNE